MAEQRGRRRHAEADVALWRRAMAGVIPLHARRSPPPPAPAREPPEPERIASGGARPAPAATPLPPLDRSAGIDRATAERLKRGRITIEARLDLHGMTQEEAYRVLGTFIAGSRAAGCRCVLVITGRGAAGGGVLRAAVPRWLAEPGLRPHLLAIHEAQPRDGGSGALYVLLRRAAPRR